MPFGTRKDIRTKPSTIPQHFGAKTKKPHRQHMQSSIITSYQPLHCLLYTVKLDWTGLNSRLRFELDWTELNFRLRFELKTIISSSNFGSSCYPIGNTTCKLAVQS